MANKQISQLPEASAVTTSDLLVLEQSGSAKKVTGQTLLDDLATALDGHGGIASISYTAPVSPSLDGTLTITLADGTTSEFTVTNGRDGVDGTDGQAGRDGVDGVTFTPAVSEQGVISWTNDGGRSNPPSVNIRGADGTNGTNGTDGVTFTPSVSAQGVISWTNDGGRVNPQSVNIKGDTGAAGAATYTYVKWSDSQPTADSDMGVVPSDWMGIYVGASSTAPTHYTDYAWYKVKGETGNNGLPIGSVTWTSNSSGDPQGTAGTTDTYTVALTDSTSVGTLEVTNGLNGTGLVDSVNGVSPVNGEVTLTASDVGAATAPLHISTTISTSPATISNAAITSTMRVIDIQFGTPTAVKKDVAWTTSDGSIVLGDASTFSSTTTVDIILMETT